MGAPIYRPKKTSRWGPVSSSDYCRSTARSTGAISREMSSLDGRPGRSTGPPAKLACTFCARRSTTRSTGPFPESRHSLAVDRVVDRPWPCTFCARRSTARSTDLWLGLAAQALESTRASSKLDFKSFVEAKHLLRS